MGMEENKPLGFRAQIRELLSRESVTIVPVTERSLKRFDATLTDLAARGAQEAGMLNVNMKPEESNAEWVNGVKGLWVFGPKEGNIASPDVALGFVNVYAPEHMDEINKMLTEKKMRPYTEGSVLEFASFGKDFPANVQQEQSAVKQTLARVFMDEQFKDVRAVSVWVTHEKGNVLDAQQDLALQTIGGIKLGSLRYAPQESVDSTAFVIPRKAFLDALMGLKK